MADASFRIHLGKLPLSTDWQLYVVPLVCSSIELTADVEWAWCSDKDSEAWRAVAAFQREAIIQTAVDKPLLKGQPVVWIKGNTEGTLFEKCVR